MDTEEESVNQNHEGKTIWWLQISRKLVDTLTFDTLITDECPDHITPTHSPLLGNADPILVHIRFVTPPH